MLKPTEKKVVNFTRLSTTLRDEMFFEIECPPGVTITPKDFRLLPGEQTQQLVVEASSSAAPGQFSCSITGSVLLDNGSIEEQPRKDIAVAIVGEPTSIPLIPEPGQYIVLNPTVEGSPEALQALGVDPNGLLFEITPALQLIVGALPIVVPCQSKADVLNCVGFSQTPPIGEVIATIPTDSNASATFELGKVVDNQLNTVVVTGPVRGLVPEELRVIVGRDEIQVGKLVGLETLLVFTIENAGAVPIQVIAPDDISSRIIVVYDIELLTVDARLPEPGSFDNPEMPGERVEQSDESEFLLSELTITESQQLLLLIEPNPDSQSRVFDIRVGPHTVKLTQEGTDSLRPAIALGGTVEEATFADGIVSNGWTSILGDFSIEGARTWGSDDFRTAALGGKASRIGQGATLLPLSLDGVSVTVGGKPAFVQFISNNQLNVLIDDDETTGTVDVVVTTPNGTSFAKSAFKRRFAPQFFRFDPNGRIHIAAVHLDGTFVGPADLFGIPGFTRPLKPGERVLLFGAGWGPTDPPTPASQLVTRPAPLANTVTMKIGGMDATVEFAGLVGSGLYQFNVVMPDLPAGDHQVEASVAGVPIEVPAFLAVEP